MYTHTLSSNPRFVTYFPSVMSSVAKMTKHLENKTHENDIISTFSVTF